ncbi:substrate import-associated zinc metallohydrolase lipoprotein [Niabella sp. 22666]|uniref:substrate import-associated zinc metallohydrolase lipoprotein n=1 Tax=Niabella sp. 22666 TaxID=3453954 RepID=UPI003F83240B
MKHIKYLFPVFLGIAISILSCSKEDRIAVPENVDYFSIYEKPRNQWNKLDSLCDTIYQNYGVKIIYEFTPRIVTGTTFFVPANYDKALQYTKVMLEGFWLKPLKARFPQYFSKETPREFIIVGGFVHFNDITSAGAAAGAGLNAQFYRLGMGGINNFDKANKAALFDHIVTLYHEHAHQQDHKYGRGYLYDRVSQADYYGLTYNSRSIAQANLDGFFTPYGGYAPEEDFATTVESMARYPKYTIDTTITKNTKLATKYRMVHTYYLEKGMDLHELNKVLDSVVYKTSY